MEALTGRTNDVRQERRVKPDSVQIDLAHAWGRAAALAMGETARRCAFRYAMLVRRDDTMMLRSDCV
jgi:hypothetical protein